MQMLFGMVLAVIFTFVKGQDQTCLFGSSTNGVGNFSEQACDLSSKRYMCETRLAQNGLNMFAERKCKQAEACRNNENSNAVQCISADAIAKQVRTCYFCCDSTNCNDVEEIP
ncbi:uncharacterized protein LOC143462077 [Clavelina lepadiformis]|uniref:uncharacterized protein LOC143462077 n=1 Tax=Clavelina lepadiformis TaxID=159417 RepID=UPI0040413040